MTPTKQTHVQPGGCLCGAVRADCGDNLPQMFCAHCGSQLFSQREKLTKSITVKASTLDGAGGLILARHIWADSAMPWVTFDDMLPCHARACDGLCQAEREI